jgi:hypothetical protein
VKRKGGTARDRLKEAWSEIAIRRTATGYEAATAGRAGRKSRSPYPSRAETVNPARGRRYKELKRLRVSEKVASAAIFSPKGPWRLSSSSALHRAFTNRRFKGHGLLSMETLVSA